MHLYTDLYNFFRIFSDWSNDTSKMGRIRGCSYDADKQRNVIVYGGNRHAIFISKMIDVCFRTSPDLEITPHSSGSDNHIVIRRPLALF